MQRRKFLVGLGSLAAGGAAATGTGALSQIRAERNITGQIVSDAKAYLKINGAGANVNSFVVEYRSDGQIRLNFDDSEVSGTGKGGQGLNPDADNWFDKAFRLLNAGPDDFEVWFSSTSDRIVFYRGKGPNSRSSLMSKSNAFTLNSGDALDIGVYLDTTGLGKGDENVLFDGDNDFTVKADPV